MNVLLLYLVATTSTTVAGLMFYMAIINLEGSDVLKKQGKQLLLIIALSILFTPLGAWLISSVVRLKKLPPMPSVN
jgi:hypothetical protein